MSRYFPHEQLDVYKVSLEFVGIAHKMLGAWPSYWAVCDHLDRASESILTNIVQAARLSGMPNGVLQIEVALGSVLECAACLDVAFMRRLVAETQVGSAKKVLQQIARMSIGLRGAWEGCVMEESEPYGRRGRCYFLHESLDVYQCSLQIHDGLDSFWKDAAIEKRHIKRIDELSTSLSLNIAEGNGRFSSLDHRKFVRIAEGAGTKLSAYLDIVESIYHLQVKHLKKDLRNAMAMLSGLSTYLEKH